MGMLISLLMLDRSDFSMKSCILCIELNSFKQLSMKYQLKLMLHVNDLSWNNPLTCSNTLLPVCVLFPLSCLAEIYLHLFPWLLLVMMQHSAKPFPPLSPCSQMCIDPEITLMGAMLEGLAEPVF